MRSIRFPSQGFMGIWGVVWLLPLMKGSLNPKSLCSASICSSDLKVTTEALLLQHQQPKVQEGPAGVAYA